MLYDYGKHVKQFALTAVTSQDSVQVSSLGRSQVVIQYRWTR